MKKRKPPPRRDSHPPARKKSKKMSSLTNEIVKLFMLMCFRRGGTINNVEKFSGEFVKRYEFAGDCKIYLRIPRGRSMTAPTIQGASRNKTTTTMLPTMPQRWTKKASPV